MTLLLTLTSTRATATLSDGLDGLRWLVGGWRVELKRATVEEYWIPPSAGTMLGVSRTVAEGKAHGFEFLRLEARADGIFYIAHPNGRPGTEFALTELDGESAVFENPEHDHPKILRYRRKPDGALVARIEGDEGVLELLYQPIPPF